MQAAEQRGLSLRQRTGGLVALALGLALLGVLPRDALAGTPAPGPSPPARAWILLDPRDGTVLAQHDARRRLPIASTTKLMTAHLARQRLRLRRRVTTPDYHPLLGESLMGLRPGEHVSVRNLLYGLLLPSGNDAAVALARAVSGSVSEFVTAMNRAAARLGLRDTHYANPIGLDAPGNYSTARDLADLAIRLRRDSVLRRIFDTEAADVDGAHPRHVVNHNDLLGEVPWVNGVKTGYTLDARYVLVGSGSRKGVTLVSVLLGAPSISDRDNGTLELLRYGLSLYSRRTPVTRGDRLRTVSVSGGELPLVAGAGVRVATRRDQAVHVQVELPAGVEGPIARGERVGTVVVLVDGKVAGRAPALAGRRVAPPGGESLVERLDDAVPGSRAAALGAAGLIAATIVIGIAVTFARRVRAG